VTHLEQTSLKLLRDAIAQHPDVLLTSAFNLNGTVLLDLAARAGFVGQVVFVDTDYHFPETLQTRDRLQALYPQLEFVGVSANLPKDDLYLTDTTACCAVRKVAPLKTYLAQRNPSALLNARSRDQAQTRANIELREVNTERVTYNPLAFWTRPDLEQYAISHGLPVNPLYWQGFLSIGCAPCTRAVAAGEDPRAGRWEGQKLECGLWDQNGISALP
jgi:phosphoadenosine phosphosulfate reductase